MISTTYDSDGVKMYEQDLHGCHVVATEIQSALVAENLHRAVGSYITIQTGNLLEGFGKQDTAGECLAEVLGTVLQPYFGTNLCICGLGNRSVAADALGPAAVANLPLKLFSAMQEIRGAFRRVCSFVPGTSWNNNMDTVALVKGVAQAVGADCLVLIDSFATKEPDRLFQTIQVSTAGGTIPYLSQQETDWSALDLPVITIGIPVAIPLRSFLPLSSLKDELLTSTRIDEAISNAALLIAYALLRVCWPSLSREECFLTAKLNHDPMPYQREQAAGAQDNVPPSSSP